MKVSLYEWYGPLSASTNLYDRDECMGDEKPHGCLDISRGNDHVDVWVYTVEEAEDLLEALQEIKDHLEDQAQEAA